MLLSSLQLSYQSSLTQQHLAAFRGAAISAIPKDRKGTDLFHNHKRNGGGHFRYPLVQYKRIQGKGHIFCYGEAIPIAESLLADDYLKHFNIHSIREEASLQRTELHPFRLRFSERPVSYRIRNWVALNQENHQQYKAIPGLLDRVAFLQPKMVNNLVSFAKGVKWELEQAIRLDILEMYPSRNVEFKGIRALAFDFSFQCNLHLPDYIGLGKGVSRGLGIIKRIG